MFIFYIFPPIMIEIKIRYKLICRIFEKTFILTDLPGLIHEPELESVIITKYKRYPSSRLLNFRC